MSKIIEFKNYQAAATEENTPILKGVDFSVETGSIHCILGKNGSGKSALAYSALGLPRYKTTGGKIIFNNKDLAKTTTYERARLGLALAFQEPARFEGLLVKDFLKAGAPKADLQKMKESLELVGLENNFLTRSLDNKLSGGERKRIEIASVIIMKPKLIIMDEPDASLDIIVYKEFYDLLNKIKQDLNCSILLITHREEAAAIASRATLIEAGRSIDTGEFSSIMRLYCHRMGRQEKCCAHCIYNKPG
jgi:Fe-S cluster assembly ATP-binding protein